MQTPEICNCGENKNSSTKIQICSQPYRLCTCHKRYIKIWNCKKNKSPPEPAAQNPNKTCDCVKNAEKTEDNKTKTENNKTKTEDNKTKIVAQIPNLSNTEICSEDNEHGFCDVMKRRSKIHWPKSKYHTKCSEKKVNAAPKRKTKRCTTLVSKSYVNKVINDEIKARQKFHNICYCMEKPQKPLLPGKGPSNMFCKHKQKNKKRIIPSPQPGSSHSLETIQKAKELLQYAPKSEFLKRLRKEVQDVYDCKCHRCKTAEMTKLLEYTPSRELLEKAYSNEFKATNLNEDVTQCGLYYKNSAVSRLNNSETSSTCSLNCKAYRPDCQAKNLSKTSLKNIDDYSSLKYLDDERIQKVGQIRRKNFFETHSLECLLKPVVPKHKCVYKFTLDDRLLPVPVNSDIYGTACCEICNKPLENPKINIERSVEANKNLNPKCSSSASSKQDFLALNNGVSSKNDILIPRHDIITTKQDNLKSTLNSLKKFSVVKENFEKGSTEKKLTARRKIPKQAKQTTCRYLNNPSTHTSVVTGRSAFASEKPFSKLSTFSSLRKVPINNENNIIQIKIPPKVLDEPKIIRFKPPIIPYNSLALRYQRGVI